jgi:hypothetical protein
MKKRYKLRENVRDYGRVMGLRGQVGVSNKIRRNDEITCICAKKILLLQANSKINLKNEYNT